MKQLVQRANNKDVEIIEVAEPSCGRGQIIVASEVSLISPGTERAARSFAEASLLSKVRNRPDLVKRVSTMLLQDGISHTFRKVSQRMSLPEALGYCVSGTVMEVSPETSTAFAPGDRVACSGAGYAVHAEMVAVPKNLSVKIPDSLSFEEAVFAPMGAIATHGLRQAGIGLGESVAVIGLGLVGLLSVGLALAAGCRVLGIDLHPQRLEAAKKMGAHLVASRENAKRAAVDLSGDEGVDAVLICADSQSNDPLQLAAAIARSRGTVVVVGAVDINVGRDQLYHKELNLKISRSLGPGRYDSNYEEDGNDYPYEYVRWTENRNMATFLDLAASGKVDVKQLITHRYKLAQASEAYEMINRRSLDCLGVLLNYNAETRRDNHKVGQKVEFGSSVHQHQGKLIVGLLGAGGFAQSTLIPAIQKTECVELKTVVSGGGMSARRAAERFNFSVMSTKENEIWSDDAINAVIIATRHNLHFNQVIDALECGKHVFVEKPLCLNAEQLAEIETAYSRAKTPLGGKPILMVGYNRRFAPLITKLKCFLDQTSEPLHIHYKVNAGFVSRDHWTQDLSEGGGRIVGEVCHFVDLLNFLTDSRPTQVFACGIDNVQRYSNDNIVANVIFENGSVGLITYLACGDTAAGKESLEVHGNGMSAFLNDYVSLQVWQDGSPKKYVQKGVLKKGHAEEMRSFFNSILNNEKAPIAFENIIMSSLTTFAIQESLLKKKMINL